MARSADVRTAKYWDGAYITVSEDADMPVDIRAAVFSGGPTILLKTDG